MRNLSIFAVSTPKDNYISQNVGSYFYGYSFDAGICKDIGGINPRWATAFACFSLFFGETWGGVSFFFKNILSFSFMPKNNENVSMVNNSTHINTDSHETALLLISELNKLSSLLSTKLSITINIIIGNNNVTNSGIVGNNMENSSIVCGDIAVNSKNLMP